MAGRITASEDQLRADPRHNSILVAKFINCLMYDGKKSVAQRVMYDALDDIDGRLKNLPAEQQEGAPESAVACFEMAIENVKPHLEVRSKRIGGANYQVPMQVSPKRRQSLAFRWVLQATRAEKGRQMSKRLADEIFAAARKEGKAMQTREQTHRMAEANKAFAHFAF
ncbi:MAG: 30S ribosomal protein S7 [Planctomycetota bacterium]